MQNLKIRSRRNYIKITKQMSCLKNRYILNFKSVHCSVLCTIAMKLLVVTIFILYSVWLTNAKRERNLWKIAVNGNVAQVGQFPYQVHDFKKKLYKLVLFLMKYICRLQLHNLVLWGVEEVSILLM